MCIYIYIYRICICIRVYIYMYKFPATVPSKYLFEGWGFPWNGSPVGGEDCYWNKSLKSPATINKQQQLVKRGTKKEDVSVLRTLPLRQAWMQKPCNRNCKANCNRSMTSGKVEIEVSLHMHWIEKSDSCLRQWNDCPWDLWILWDIWTASGSNMSMGRCYWLLLIDDVGKWYWLVVLPHLPPVPYWLTIYYMCVYIYTYIYI